MKSVAAAVLVLAAGVWAAARPGDPPAEQVKAPPPPANAPAPPPVPLPDGLFALINQEVEVFAADLKRTERPRTADRFRIQTERIRLRADAIRQLAEQSDRQLDELEVRARELAAGAKGELLDARVALEFDRRYFDGMVRYEPTHQHDLRTAETRVIRARERVAGLEKPGSTAAAGVSARGDDGRDVTLTTRQREQLDSFAADVLGTCRTEATDGPPAAARWAAALKSGPVRVRYAELRAFRPVASRVEVPVEEFVVPASAGRGPDVVLTRVGTTYRAFRDWRPEWADAVRAVLRGEP
jgi:hypothetical protein